MEPNISHEFDKSLMIVAAESYASGKFEFALACYKELFEVKKTLYGNIHTITGNACNNIAHCYLKLGVYQSALHWFLENLKIFKQIMGDHHKEIVPVYRNLGYTLFKLNELGEARFWFGLAYDVLKECFPAAHPEIIEICREIEEKFGKYLESGEVNITFEYFRDFFDDNCYFSFKNDMLWYRLIMEEILDYFPKKCGILFETKLQVYAHSIVVFAQDFYNVLDGGEPDITEPVLYNSRNFLKIDSKCLSFLSKGNLFGEPYEDFRELVISCQNEIFKTLRFSYDSSKMFAALFLAANIEEYSDEDNEDFEDDYTQYKKLLKTDYVLNDILNDFSDDKMRAFEWIQAEM